MAKHLLVHIWPRRDSGAWITFLEHLRQRWSIFDGVKRFAMMSSPEAASPQELRDMLPEDAEVKVFVNDPKLREVVAFPWLLKQVVDLPGETLCCHAKGVTHTNDSPVHLWRDMMTHVCLDWPRLVECALAKFPIAGCFKRPLMSFGSVNVMVPWHYSGTFFWLRNDILRTKDWAAVDQHSHGAETWPARHFKWDEAACLFDQRHEVPYGWRYWELMAKPDYLRWEAALRSSGVSMTASSLPTWLEKLRQRSPQSPGTAGSGMTAPGSVSSQDLDIYFPYVRQYLPR